jgi:hypothetical protein
MVETMTKTKAKTKDKDKDKYKDKDKDKDKDRRSRDKASQDKTKPGESPRQRCRVISVININDAMESKRSIDNCEHHGERNARSQECIYLKD